ncbi:unnamed protein product [Tilletia controversa]|uniref:Uncharacterized protein n=3 Tax=Tilletia TaxID=13289 RepID=A0A8X7SZE2_9BASI|nr:hypothetical protein CF336_g3490 [Tilletia laevis]KAE8202474.1 hypothetical protein CF328_g2197 [Tilletia controversa]KAE8264378.1 hypothetical protein A4X03_0g991 [Tilletia caries]KAE8206837.1 hypothetical protein CF335_g1577 [Tilletia laevis]KAE8252900.1 hypothetical protein A4X06_0g1845 [Tilletia controversa]
MGSDVRPSADSFEDGDASIVNTLSAGIPMSMPAILINPKPASRLLANPNPNRTSVPLRHKPGVAIEGKRRLLRSAHFHALTTGPGAGRPTNADYVQPAKPNAVRSTFPQPMPPEVARALKLSREEQVDLVRSATAAAGSSSSLAAGSAEEPGHFEVSLREARRFLKERLGVVPRADQVFPPNGKVEYATPPRETREGEVGPSTRGAAFVVEDHAMQRFADIVEDELDAWLGTEVYVRPDQQEQDRQTRTIVDADFVRPRSAAEKQTEAEAEVEPTEESSGARGLRRSEGANRTRDSEPCVMEISSAPHSLRWHIPSPLLRYAVHCLARMHGCPSFSKDAVQASNSNSNGTPSQRVQNAGPVRREIWILNPNPAARGARSRAPAPAPRRSTLQAALQPPSTGTATAIAIHPLLGLETPPTTDIGTDSEAGLYEDGGSSSEAEHPVVGGLNGLNRSLMDSVVWSESEDERGGIIIGGGAGGASSDGVDADDDSSTHGESVSAAGDETITTTTAPTVPATTTRIRLPLSASIASLASCEAGSERESEDEYDDARTDDLEMESLAGSVLSVDNNGDGPSTMNSGGEGHRHAVER